MFPLSGVKFVFGKVGPIQFEMQGGCEPRQKGAEGLLG